MPHGYLIEKGSLRMRDKKGDLPPVPIQLLPREELDKIYDQCKPLVTSNLNDIRILATILCQLIEAIRGDEKRTELPPRHHA